MRGDSPMRRHDGRGQHSRIWFSVMFFSVRGLSLEEDRCKFEIRSRVVSREFVGISNLRGSSSYDRSAEAGSNRMQSLVHGSPQRGDFKTRPTDSSNYLLGSLRTNGPVTMPRGTDFASGHRLVGVGWNGL